jgi:hypothetical protein
MRKISLVLCLCAIAASPVLAAKVTIKVVDPLEKPVQGVQVMVCENLKGCPAPQAKTPRTNRLGIYTTDIQARAVGYVNAPSYVEMSRVLVKGMNIFKLEAATQVTGTVVDTQRKPVAGASIQLVRATRPDGSMVSYSCSPFSRSFVFKTAADGRYVVPGLPAQGEVWLILQDPRFAEGSINAQLGANAPAAPPMVARPAAQIAGKVVYGNGKPAAGVSVMVSVSTMGTSFAGTKADGSYLLQSLAAGQATIAATGSGEWVSSSVRDLTTVEGKTVNAPNIVLSSGAIIEGTVADEATGKPRPGIEIMVGGPQGSWMTAGGARATSDKTGHYRVRVGPGANTIQLFNSDGFGRPEPHIRVEVTNGEKKTVPIKVRTQVVLTGKLVDTTGKPLADQRMSVMVMADEEHNVGMGGRACTDKAGKFRVTDLVPGKVRLTLGNDFDVQAWEVVQPKNLMLPAPGPVKFVVRKVDIGKLEGRVTTPAGKPVSGAVVSVWVEAAEPETWLKTPSLSTNADGVYRVDGFKPGMKIIFKSAKKPGFAYRSGGVFTAKDKKASISDIVLTPLTGKLAGRVTDSTGAPVANTRVAALEGGADSSALTRADGGFQLGSIPDGNVTVIAATGSSYGSVKANGGAPVEIKLENSPKVDAAQIYAVLQECWDETSKKPEDNWWRTRIPVLLMQTNPDLALKMIWANGSLDEDAALETTLALVRREPGRALQWGMALLDDIKNPHTALRAACVLGISAAGYHTEVARSLYARAKDNIGKSAKASPATQEAYRTLGDYAHLAALAGKLQNGEGDAMLDKLVEAAKQIKEPDSQALANQADVIAMGSVPLAEKLAGQMTGMDAIIAMTGIAIEASYYDIAAARRVLEQIEKASGNETNHGAYGEAALYVILALGKTDPSAALEVARSVHNDRYRKLALGIAAPFQPRDAQIAVLREAFGAVGADYHYVAEDMSWIAWMAHSVDPSVGDEMFASAKAKLLADPEQESSELTAYAMHYAAADPALSRLMLETAFNQFKQPGQSRGAWALEEAAVAMSVVDVGRAVELAKQIRDLTNRGRALTRIARYALSSDDQKQNLMRLHWTRSECWYYNGPSPW